MKLAIILVATLGLVFASSSAFATTSSPANTDKNSGSGDPIFMNYQGVAGDVNGNGCSAIQLDSFQWGIGFSSAAGTGTGAGAGTASLKDIVVTKKMDKSSPLLLKEALSGKAEPVKIDFCKKFGGGKLLPYAEYSLDHTLVSKYGVSSGGDTPQESISMNFEKIKFTFFEYGPNGTPTGSVSVSFDVFGKVS